MLIVTHEIGFARDASDRIVFMADGIINAQGAPNALMAQVADNERLRNFLSRFSATAH
jgi:polar amino acid transport system ATP-binding protein